MTIVRPAFRNRVPLTAPQPHPVDAPTPIPAAGMVGGSAGGIGGLFFFGLAALLALAGLVRAGMISVLRRTPHAATPQPFLALLERPG
ncbi:MAG TPA: hypothetical protein VFH80_34180 [Solirubrobacteraceae bacterium]|nr:hypothetical protein [Solirubrobacteraceae bacterium]